MRRLVLAFLVFSMGSHIFAQTIGSLLIIETESAKLKALSSAAIAKPTNNADAMTNPAYLLPPNDLGYLQFYSWGSEGFTENSGTYGISVGYAFNDLGIRFAFQRTDPVEISGLDELGNDLGRHQIFDMAATFGLSRSFRFQESALIIGANSSILYSRLLDYKLLTGYGDFGLTYHFALASWGKVRDEYNASIAVVSRSGSQRFGQTTEVFSRASVGVAYSPINLGFLSLGLYLAVPFESYNWSLYRGGFLARGVEITLFNTLILRLGADRSAFINAFGFGVKAFYWRALRVAFDFSGELPANLGFGGFSFGLRLDYQLR